MNNEFKIEGNKAFAVYNMPGEKDHYLIIGDIVNEIPENGGFILQSFDNNQQRKRIIQAKSVIKNAKFDVSAIHTLDEKETPMEDYLKSVLQSLDAIHKKGFKKIVVSRLKVVRRNQQSPFEIFDRLKQTYSSAFVYLYHIPGEGMWAGASPEILIRADGQHYRTSALAGTQKASGNNIDKVLWGTKEKNEQGLIEEFIEENLLNSHASFTKKGPSTVKAGQMFHIQSTYDFRLDDDIFHFIKKLHPGPAICGLPKEKSLALIKQIEGHERKHYCGYIGPWNINNEKALFINLRCMQIFQEHFVLYVGGGITSDSDPESEWAETELKAQTMLSVINKFVLA